MSAFLFWMSQLFTVDLVLKCSCIFMIPDISHVSSLTDLLQILCVLQRSMSINAPVLAYENKVFEMLNKKNEKI